MISPLLGSFSVPFFAWWLFFVLSPPQTGGPPSEHGRRTDDSIAPQAQEPGETILYFPDYVDGGGWSVQLVLSNVDPEAAAEVQVVVYDPDGQPVLDLFGSDLTLEIPSLGSRVLRSAGSGAIRRGWIQVQTGAATVGGLLTYRDVQSGVEVGVEPVQLGHEFALFVEESGTIGAGLALFKPDASSRIELRLRDEEGNDPLEGVFLPWRDFNQEARTLPEWFDVQGVDTAFLADFRGLLFLRTEDDSLFAPLGLRFGKGTSSLSAVPAIRITDGGGIDGGHTPLQIYNDNVVVLPVAENLAALWMDSGNSPPLQDYAARFYEHFNDEFDFLIFFANVRLREIELEPGSLDGAYFHSVKNDVQGIGQGTFSDNNYWESAGKLQGMIFSSVYGQYHPRFGYSDFRQGQLLHELMHRWAAYLGEPLSDGHWNEHSNVRGSLGGVFRSEFEEIVDLGGDRYTGAKDPVDPKEQLYPPLELYLAGFIPSEEVPDIWAAVDGERILDDFEPYFDEETGRWVDNLLRDETGIAFSPHAR